MNSVQTEKYWNRIKTSILVLPSLFIFTLIVWSVQVPPDVSGAEVKFSTYPVANASFWILFISIFLIPVVLIHSIWKDKHVISKKFDGVNQRHWITIVVFNFVTGGFYSFWYFFVRYIRTKNQTTDDTQESDTSPAPDNDSLQIFDHEDSLKISDMPDSAKDNLILNIKNTIDKADSARKNAGEAYDIGDYDRAVKLYNEAQESYKNAYNVANSNNISTTAISQRLTVVQNKQQQILRQQVKNDIKTIKSSVSQANNLTDDNKFEQAQERYEEIKSRITTAKETAKKHSFGNLFNDLKTIEQRVEENITEIKQSNITEIKQSVHSEIPCEPDVSIENDAWTENEHIGGGGNADVYRATLSAPNEDITIAIKKPRMSGTLHTDQIERILNEAETWKKLDDHDHIVGIVDYGNTPIPWIAMEHMDGGHLGGYKDEIDIRQALWTAISITKGVRHAHRKGIAHLDLKPENILFRTINDSWDVPKVADWGLSKHLLEHSKSVEGYTPTYSAPEQLDNGYGKSDDITDVYQLGAVFYELFTGQPPFEADNTGQIIRQALDQDPTPPSKIADVPDGLDRILLKALEKKKNNRYDNIVYLRDNLQEIYRDY